MGLLSKRHPCASVVGVTRTKFVGAMHWEQRKQVKDVASWGVRNGGCAQDSPSQEVGSTPVDRPCIFAAAAPGVANGTSSISARDSRPCVNRFCCARSISPGPSLPAQEILFGHARTVGSASPCVLEPSLGQPPLRGIARAMPSTLISYQPPRVSVRLVNAEKSGANARAD